MGPWLSWLQWLSIFKYTFQALALNELTGFTFVCTDSEYIHTPGGLVCPITSGDVLLKNLGLADQDLWFPLVMLIVMTVFFRALALVFLYWQTNRVLKRN